jgi:hypothetical protein
MLYFRQGTHICRWTRSGVLCMWGQVLNFGSLAGANAIATGYVLDDRKVGVRVPVRPPFFFMSSGLVLWSMAHLASYPVVN